MGWSDILGTFARGVAPALGATLQEPFSDFKGFGQSLLGNTLKNVSSPETGQNGASNAANFVQNTVPDFVQNMVPWGNQPASKPGGPTLIDSFLGGYKKIPGSQQPEQGDTYKPLFLGQGVPMPPTPPQQPQNFNSQPQQQEWPPKS